MKKFFFIISCVSAILLLSCASSPKEEDYSTPLSQNEKSSEELSITKDSTAEFSTENELSDQAESENKNSENEDLKEANSLEESENYSENDEVIFLDDDQDTNEQTSQEDYINKNFPLPQAFEEPLVRTLEAEDEDSLSKENEKESSSPPLYEEIKDEDLLSQKDFYEENLDENDDVIFLVDGDDIISSDDIIFSDDIISSDDIIFSDDNITSSDDNIISSDDDLTAEDNSISSFNDEISNTSLKNEQVPIPSRKVTMKKNEYVDITYPGTGWIFLGLTDNSRDIAYYGTKLGNKDTTFSLQARKAGNKILHFYKNDALTNEYIDDYIEIEVTNETGSNKKHIAAPKFQMPVPTIKSTNEEKEISSGQTDKDEKLSSEGTSSEKASSKNSSIEKTSSENTAPEMAESKNTSSKASSSEITSDEVKNSSSSNSSSSNSSSSNSSTLSESENKLQNSLSETKEISFESSTQNIKDSKTLLQEAIILYNEKEYSSAKKKIEEYFENPTQDIDHAYFLLGQVLEAKSEVQNIKSALNAYNMVTKNYPASLYWEDANKRIIYLKRFYLEAR